MILIHARALAHTAIRRVSQPETTYLKAAPVPEADEAAEDWEPVPPVYEEPEPPADCGCGEKP